MSGFETEVAKGGRFEFGKNWSEFLRTIDDERILQAQNALQQVLGVEGSVGGRFLDIGSGSGLMSLAARRLGMSVVSFDYDPASVACTNELRRRYYPNDEAWKVMEGSILDADFVNSLGRHDVVYSWGVLHHTGAMWLAIEQASALVSDTGTLVIAIYNDQGPWSRIWRRIKATYNKLPRALRKPFVLAVMVPREMKIALVPILKLKPMAYFSLWGRGAGRGNRGMNRWYDYIDWVGGFPFEVAKPEEIFEFCRSKGFTLVGLKTCAGELGCNEFVFRREAIDVGKQSAG